MKDLQAQKLASMLLDYLRATNQGALPPNLVKDLKIAAAREDKSNSIIVTSALAVDAEDKKTISEFIGKKFKAQPKIEYKVNPELIAGFTLRIGDELIDASVRSKLATLKDHLTLN